MERNYYFEVLADLSLGGRGVLLATDSSPFRRTTTCPRELPDQTPSLSVPPVRTEDESSGFREPRVSPSQTLPPQDVTWTLAGPVVAHLRLVGYCAEDSGGGPTRGGSGATQWGVVERPFPV